MKPQDKFKQFLEENSIFEKPLFIGGVILGFIYFNGYLSEFDIPFPLDIGVLPTTLIVIGSLSIFFLLLIFFYVLLVGLINLDPLSVKFHRLINTTSSGIYAQKLRNSITYGLISYVFPFAFFLTLVTYYEFESNLRNNAILIVSYSTWAFIYSFGLVKDSVDPINEKIKNAFLMTVHVFFVQFVSLVSLGIFLLIVLSRAKGISDIELLLLVFCYAIINFICILPTFSKEKFDRIHKSEEKFNYDQIIQKSQRYPTYLIMGILLAFSLTPNISPYIGELPIKALNIGSGITMTVSDTRRQCDAWPKFILDKDASGKDFCVTKPGKLIIQLGTRAYFIFHKEKIGPLVISLDLSKSATTWKLQENSLYFSSSKYHQKTSKNSDTESEEVKDN